MVLLHIRIKTRWLQPEIKATKNPQTINALCIKNTRSESRRNKVLKDFKHRFGDRI